MEKKSKEKLISEAPTYGDSDAIPAYIVEDLMQTYSDQENERLRDALQNLLSHAPSIDMLGNSSFDDSFYKAIKQAEQALENKEG